MFASNIPLFFPQGMSLWHCQSWNKMWRPPVSYISLNLIENIVQEEQRNSHTTLHCTALPNFLIKHKIKEFTETVVQIVIFIHIKLAFCSNNSDNNLKVVLRLKRDVKVFFAPSLRVQLWEKYKQDILEGWVVWVMLQWSLESSSAAWCSLMGGIQCNDTIIHQGIPNYHVQWQKLALISSWVERLSVSETVRHHLGKPSLSLCRKKTT